MKLKCCFVFSAVCFACSRTAISKIDRAFGSKRTRNVYRQKGAGENAFTVFPFVKGGSSQSNEDDSKVEQSQEEIEVTINTGTGTRFLDQRCQLSLPNTFTIAQLKEKIRERMAGDPPVCFQRIFFQSSLLEDQQVLGQLLDVSKREEEAAAADSQPLKKQRNSLALLLDMVPPLKTPEDVDEPVCAVPTELKDRIKAYSANAAALQHVSELYFRYITRKSLVETQTEMLSGVLRDNMASIEEFVSALPVSELPKDPASYIIPLSQRNETALDRFRISFKKQFDVDWSESFRLMLLLLLFSSGAIGQWKHILQLMTPLVLISQIRYVKYLLKVARNSLPNVPALSEYLGALMPATHSMLLTFDEEAYVNQLFGDNIPEKQSTS